LALTGASVLIVDADVEAAEHVADDINKEGLAAAIADGDDVSVAAEVRRYVAVAADTWGSLDAVLHAAAVPGPAALITDFEETESQHPRQAELRKTSHF
jgi:NAD(P)-dependent dehydrogenase (short-subunit alcohol dehydrogenase family)